MVTHIVFFSPFLAFDFVSVALGCSALTAAGPFVVFVLGVFLGLLLFLFSFRVDLREEESKLVAAVAAEDGGSMGPLS